MTFECTLVQLTMTSAKTFEIVTVTEKYPISFKIIFLIQKWGKYESEMVGKETSLAIEGRGGRKNGENGLLRLWLNVPSLFRFQIILLEGIKP